MTYKVWVFVLGLLVPIFVGADGYEPLKKPQQYDAPVMPVPNQVQDAIERPAVQFELLKADPVVVFFLHGLGGDTSTFADMPQILKDEFGERVLIKVLSYDTNHKSKSQFMFVDEIAPQMNQFYQLNKLDLASTPFIFIAHSQGGIIARNYLATCLRPFGTVMPSGIVGKPWRDCKQDVAGDVQVPSNLRMLITLGTPHWGSPIGNRASGNPILSWAGGARYAQDKQLSIGSSRMFIDRHSMIQSQINWRKLDKELSFFYPESKLRFVSIAGNIGSHLDYVDWKIRSVLKYVTTSDINEDDLVVPASMGNPNFHYYIEADRRSSRSRRVRGKFRFWTERGYLHSTQNVYTAPNPHMSVDGSGNTQFVGVAQPVRKGNTLPNHIPTLHVLREMAQTLFSKTERAQFFADTIVALSADEPVKKVTEFSSDLVIRFPEGYQRKPDVKDDDKDISKYITITQEPFESGKDGTIETFALSNSVVFKDYGLNKADSDFSAKPYIVFFHSGRFAAQDAITYGTRDKKARMCYDIRFPGYQTKHICNLVTPGESSYTEVLMVPNRPFLATDSLKQDHTYYLKNDTLLVGYQSSTNEGITVSTDGAETISVRPWNDIAALVDSQKAALDPTALDQLRNQCAVAVAGAPLTKSRNYIYPSPTSPEPRSASFTMPSRLSNGQKIQLIGRYVDTMTDRYLMRSGVVGESWVDAEDLDILENSTCSR